jgi:hypothetical protein
MHGIFQPDKPVKATFPDFSLRDSKSVADIGL